MKKTILWIVIIIAFIAICLGGIYLIDMNRMDNNKPVLFSTWGYDYAPPEINPNELSGESLEINSNGLGTEHQSVDEFSNFASGDEDEKKYKRFVGTVLEETTTYMIVEPNEDELERKSSDKIRINYGVDHLDYVYGVGRKVLITYSGYIMETYPAQINTNHIDADGYSDFDFSIVWNGELPGIDIALMMLGIEDKYNSNRDIGYCNLRDVNVNINGVGIYSLYDAITSGKITMSGILAKANRDNDKGLNEKITYRDGGSTIWIYDDYAVLKMNSLDGNNNIYIGPSNMAIDDVKNMARNLLEEER